MIKGLTRRRAKTLGWMRKHPYISMASLIGVYVANALTVGPKIANLMADEATKLAPVLASAGKVYIAPLHASLSPGVVLILAAPCLVSWAGYKMALGGLKKITFKPARSKMEANSWPPSPRKSGYPSPR